MIPKRKPNPSNVKNPSILTDPHVHATSEGMTVVEDEWSLEATEFEITFDQPVPEYLTEEEEKKRNRFKILNTLKEYATKWDIHIKFVKGKAPPNPARKVVWEMAFFWPVGSWPCVDWL